MKPQNALAHKGDAVEEWTDVHFFRPAGVRIARLLGPTRVSADQVTLWCLVVGLVAGHLFAYQSRSLNLLGVALFIVSDILDSADGQLARLRGTSSRFGRTLDGIADATRFANLYAHLLARMYLTHQGWHGYALVAAAGLSHSFQSQIVDFIKNAYQRLGDVGGDELDLPEDLAPVTGFGPRQIAQRIYRVYVQRQELLFPWSLALLRAAPGPPSAACRDAYVARQRPLLAPLAFIAQNIRFLLLAVASFHRIGWFLWVTVVPLNLIAAAIVTLHERHASVLLEEVRAAVKVRS